MRTPFKLLLMTCLCLFPVTTSAAKWHMPTPYPEGEHHTRNIRTFANDVREKTDGELQIVVHSGAALFQHPEIHRAVRSGQVPIGEMLMGLLGNEDPLFKVDNIPFLATDFDAARRLWKVSRPYVEKSLDEQGLALLFAVPWPPQGLYANRAVDDVADLEGVRMRAYSPLTSQLSRLLGASPVNVQTPEIAQAFSTGMIETMFTSPSTGVSSQAWDFVDYYIDTRAWIPKNMVIVNKRALRRLPGDHRKALLDAAGRAETRGWQMTETETREKTRELAENGMTVLEPGKTLQQQLAETGRQIAREWAAETGERGDEILEAMDRQ